MYNSTTVTKINMHAIAAIILEMLGQRIKKKSNANRKMRLKNKFNSYNS